MVHEPKRSRKIQTLLGAAIILALLLIIPIYLIVTRWSKTIVGMDMVYIFLYSLMAITLYFFPQILFFQTIKIDDTNITVRRAGFLPDQLVFSKRDVAYCRLDRKDGTPLALQNEDPELKDGCAVAFVLKNGMKVTSDRIHFDGKAFAEFCQVLPNLLHPGEAKTSHTSAKHEVKIRQTRHFEILFVGVILAFLGYVFYKVAFH